LKDAWDASVFALVLDTHEFCCDESDLQMETPVNVGGMQVDAPWNLLEIVWGERVCSLAFGDSMALYLLPDNLKCHLWACSLWAISVSTGVSK